MLLEVRKIADVSAHMDKIILEGVRSYGGGSLEDGVSKFLRGIGVTKNVCYSRKDIITRYPSLDDAG